MISQTRRTTDVATSMLKGNDRFAPVYSSSIGFSFILNLDVTWRRVEVNVFLLNAPAIQKKDLTFLLP